MDIQKLVYDFKQKLSIQCYVYRTIKMYDCIGKFTKYLELNPIP